VGDESLRSWVRQSEIDAGRCYTALGVSAGGYDLSFRRDLEGGTGRRPASQRCRSPETTRRRVVVVVVPAATLAIGAALKIDEPPAWGWCMDIYALTGI